MVEKLVNGQDVFGTGLEKLESFGSGTLDNKVNKVDG